MDKLSAMQTFIAIADEGSLTGAAEVLGKAIPTVVRSLALLEEELGVRLLQRTTRRNSLTDEGRTYLERCRRIVAHVEEAELEASNHRVEPQGMIRVTAPLLFGQKKVAPVFREFLNAYPKVQVDLVLVDRVVNLVDEGFDLGLRIAPLPDSTLMAVRLGQVQRQLVASPSFQKAQARLSNPRELLRRPAVLFSGSVQIEQWPFIVNGKKVHLAMNGQLRCNHAQVAIDACVGGLGYGYFLSYQIEDLVESGKLVPLLKKNLLPPIPVHIVFPESRLLSARARVLIDWLKQKLRV